EPTARLKDAARRLAVAVVDTLRAVRAVATAAFARLGLDAEAAPAVRRARAWSVGRSVGATRQAVGALRRAHAARAVRAVEAVRADAASAAVAPASLRSDAEAAQALRIVVAGIAEGAARALA